MGADQSIIRNVNKSETSAPKLDGSSARFDPTQEKKRSIKHINHVIHSCCSFDSIVANSG